jgi:hypothetical protein
VTLLSFVTERKLSAQVARAAISWVPVSLTRPEMVRPGGVLTNPGTPGRSKAPRTRSKAQSPDSVSRALFLTAGQASKCLHREQERGRPKIAREAGWPIFPSRAWIFSIALRRENACVL